MSSNDIIWMMFYEQSYHVFYSGCADNKPEKPDLTNRYYKNFNDKSKAFRYAHDIERKINDECFEDGFPGVEYGVCKVDENF